MKKKQTKIVIVLIFLMLSIAFVRKSITQNDTFYLIKLGDYITHNGIDLMDHYSWISGLSYSYPHWLHSITLFFIYNNFGYDGLYVFDILSFFVMIVSIYYINLKVNSDKFVAFFISLLSFPLLMYFINPRAQTISCILFLWEIYYIIQLIKTANKKYIILLTITSLLIANIHGTSWIMFFVLFLPFFGNQLIYQIIKKSKKNKFDYAVIIEKTNNIQKLLIAFVLSFLMGLLTPSRICYTYFFKVLQGESQGFIAEHAPLIIIECPFILIILFLLYFSKEKIKLHELFMITGLLLMSFISIRHLIFFLTIGLLFLSILLTRNVKSQNDPTFNILYNRIFYSNKRSLLILAFSIIIAIIGFKVNTKTDYIDNIHYPIEATKYIKSNLDYQNIRLYNDYQDGSYLLFNDVKVFIDPRYDLYSIAFNHKLDIFADFLSIEYNYEYENVFDKYQIDYVLLNKNYVLYHILKNNSNYPVIYQDNDYCLFLRIKENNNEKKT